MLKKIGILIGCLILVITFSVKSQDLSKGYDLIKTCPGHGYNITVLKNGHEFFIIRTDPRIRITKDYHIKYLVPAFRSETQLEFVDPNGINMRTLVYLYGKGEVSFAPSEMGAIALCRELSTTNFNM